MNKYLFIGGVGHSGTTMLDKIFSKHTKSVGARGESRLADSLGLVRNEYAKIKNKKDAYKYLCEVIYNGYRFKKQQYLYESDPNNPFYNSEVNLSILPEKVEMAIKSVVDETMARKNSELFVEKTPSNVFHIGDIHKIFPEAKVLIIHRDVRDVVASLKKRYQTLLNNPETFSHNLHVKKLDKDYNLVIDSLMWNKAVKVVPNSIDSIKVVKYEDFVADPQNQTKEICEWIGIDFEEQMLQIKNSNSSDLGLVSSTGISTASVGSFQKTLSSPELAVIQKYAVSGLQALSYELTATGSKDKLIGMRFEIREYMKIPVRVIKRFRLMNFSYFLNFGRRFLKKLSS